MRQFNTRVARINEPLRELRLLALAVQTLVAARILQIATRLRLAERLD